MVSGGKVLGTERRHNEAMVRFFLTHRRPERYGRAIGPGHPLYERLRAQILAEDHEDEQEVLDSIDAFIEDMRQRRLANAAVIEQLQAEEEDGEA